MRKSAHLSVSICKHCGRRYKRLHKGDPYCSASCHGLSIGVWDGTSKKWPKTKRFLNRHSKPVCVFP
jgi:endogenous inhibitor of DNA gyrase (YacG/DUF329 family)